MTCNVDEAACQSQVPRAGREWCGLVADCVQPATIAAGTRAAGREFPAGRHSSARACPTHSSCYRRTAENLERLAQALQETKPTLRGAPADLPFRIDAKSLALGSNFTFDTRFGPFDLLGDMEPLGGYDNVVGSTEVYQYGPWQVRALSLDDLIRIKEHIQRVKDQASLVELIALKRARENLRDRKND